MCVCTGIPPSIDVRNAIGQLGHRVRRCRQRIVRIAGVDGRMRHVQEQRLRSIVRRNQAHRFVGQHVRCVLAGQIVGDLHAAAHIQAVAAALLGAMVKVVLVAGPVAEVAIEAALLRRVLAPKVSQMPLANDVRGIAQMAQVLGQQALGERKAARLGGIEYGVLHTGVNRMAAGHQGGS